MGATAQIFKSAFAVQRHVLISRNAGDDFSLVVLADGLEMGHRLVARQHTARDRLVFGGERGHALFNRGQVFRRERALVGKIVEKPVFNHRPDGHLRLGKQLLDRVSQQMRRAVADQLQAIRILGGDDGQGAVLADEKAGIDQLAIDFAAQRCLGQAGADRGGHISHRQRMGKLALRTVGKRNLDHDKWRRKKDARNKAPPKAPLWI